jgi:hypothetical protein
MPRNAPALARTALPSPLWGGSGWGDAMTQIPTPHIAPALARLALPSPPVGEGQGGGLS